MGLNVRSTHVTHQLTLAADQYRKGEERTKHQGNRKYFVTYFGLNAFSSGYFTDCD